MVVWWRFSFFFLRGLKAGEKTMRLRLTEAFLHRLERERDREWGKKEI